MAKVGIPRALVYYQYLPLWRTFFAELGAEIVVSPETTHRTLMEGSARVVADTCLPVKIFLGHVIALIDKCDFVFIPAIRSIRPKIFNCSKFLGLPDMTRAVIPRCPPILDIEIDINRGRRFLYRQIFGLGRHFHWNPVQIRRAALRAWQAHLSFRDTMAHQALTPPQVFGGQSHPNRPAAGTGFTIAVVGHPYLLYDDFINHRVRDKLAGFHIDVRTPEMLDRDQLQSGIRDTVGTGYWTYEEDVLGAGGYFLSQGIDGIIGLMAFGCGPDSLMMDGVRRQAHRRQVPFLCLTLDEHTAEAGVVTRLEAFTDMIFRRRQVQTCA